MKTKEQIKQKIEQLFQKRLCQRMEKYLSKHYKNCLFNISKEINSTEHCFCTNVKNPEVQKEIICLCESIEKCQKCKHYVCKHSKDSVEKDFISDISNPSVCGVKEPKLAVLLWVLRNGSGNIDEKQNTISCFFKKIFLKEKR